MYLRAASTLVAMASNLEAQDHATFYLLLDVIPAIAILTSAVVAGLSADIDKDSALWKVLEMLCCQLTPFSLLLTICAMFCSLFHNNMV